MLADLHCHYPMHLLAETPRDLTLERATQLGGWATPVQRVRAAVLALAARLLNFERFGGTWRVDLDGLERGDVRVVLSVLYHPFSEMDLDEPYGAAPQAAYYPELVAHLHDVEAELSRLDPDERRHVVVRSADDLAGAIAGGRVAFVHAIEGGFHLGDRPDAVHEHVAELAGLGVGYVTLAHLFWRRVATNANALPFLPDRIYDLIFPQPRGAGLTDLGVAAVEAMYRHRVLIDVSHMRQDALDETFALLDRLDRETGADPGDFPVIASHAAFRVGGQPYNLSADTARRIAARDGVVGLILAQHQMNDGIRRKETTTLAESVEVVARHIDAIREATGSYDHVGLGTDLDGFIKPVLGGLETSAAMAGLQAALRERYGDEAEKILSGNAVRVLTRVLGARPVS